MGQGKNSLTHEGEVEEIKKTKQSQWCKDNH